MQGYAKKRISIMHRSVGDQKWRQFRHVYEHKHWHKSLGFRPLVSQSGVVCPKMNSGDCVMFHHVYPRRHIMHVMFNDVSPAPSNAALSTM